MSIVTVTAADRAEFLNLVNAEIRPDHAKTNAWDDFPVILGASNSHWQMVFKTGDGTIAGCIACLIRNHETSCGVFPIAGIGSVVTHPDFRGKGISTALQNEMLAKLMGKNIPLGVLWTDQPEIYSGRGFESAGWELHASVSELAISKPLNPLFRIRPYSPVDTPAIQMLFDAHPWRTVREPDDANKYYGMPGTTGFVITNRENEILASAFCGKGGDFAQYITEFCGDLHLLPHLFQFLWKNKLATQVLIPPGAEELVNILVDLGSNWMTTPSGQWVVLNPDALAGLVAGAGGKIPENKEGPGAWLGNVGPDGMPIVGPITTAIWGFDSV